MKKHYIANLDGLRFIAAITVACSHLEVAKSYATPISLQNRFVKNAPQISVTFFFVLSGFLIMWWFLEETNGNLQKINLKKFYVNRLSRTWPLYFLLVIISLVISLSSGAYFQNSETGKRYFFYFLFMPNTADVFYGSDVYLSPTWSLAVEEFFYLFFPLIILRFRKETIVRSLLLLVTATLVFSILLNPIFISLIAKKGTNLLAVVQYASIVADRYRFYSFLLGALSATLVFQNWPLPPFTAKVSIKRMVYVFGWLILALFLFGITFSFATQQIYSVLFSLLFYGMMRGGYVNRFLNSGLIKTGGKISYGIYLLHMLIVYRLITQLKFLLPTGNIFLNVFVSWGLLLILTLILSYLSFKYFEMPVRNWLRNRFTKPAA